MKYNFPYTLHEFLDRELALFGGDPPMEILLTKKKEYRSLYARWYRNIYRERIRQVTIQFTNTELKKLTEKAGEIGVRLSVYIKSCLEGNGEQRTTSPVLLPLVLSLRDVIEDCLHEQSLEGLEQTLSIVQSLISEI